MPKKNVYKYFLIRLSFPFIIIRCLFSAVFLCMIFDKNLHHLCLFFQKIFVSFSAAMVLLDFPLISFAFLTIWHKITEIRSAARQTWFHVRMGTKAGKTVCTTHGQRSTWTSANRGDWEEIQCHRRYCLYRHHFFACSPLRHFHIPL